MGQAADCQPATRDRVAIFGLLLWVFGAICFLAGAEYAFFVLPWAYTGANAPRYEDYQVVHWLPVLGPFVTTWAGFLLWRSGKSRPVRARLLGFIAVAGIAVFVLSLVYTWWKSVMA